MKQVARELLDRISTYPSAEAISINGIRFIWSSSSSSGNMDAFISRDSLVDKLENTADIVTGRQMVRAKNYFVRSKNLDRTLQKQNPSDQPTRANYADFQRAFHHFNQYLFAKKLPLCMITLQRYRKARGYFKSEGWRDANGMTIDEISINPESVSKHIQAQDYAVPLSTLVHEMAHQWQHHFGLRKSIRGYHNREWAQKMREVGLIPSDTGKPGGNPTGYRVSHFIEEDGPFDEACRKLIKRGFQITWRDNWNRRPKGEPKTHYKCRSCGVSCWAKPDCEFICGVCKRTMIELS